MIDAISLPEDPFIEAGDAIAGHPFLQEARKGELAPEVWATYISNRLGAGSHFVSYLGTLVQTASQKEHLVIASAVKKNLDEELGIDEGRIKLERSHEEWRRWFREDMQKLLAKDSFHIRIPEADAYPVALQKISETGDVIEMSGALTALELLIAREYEQILAGLEMQFGDRISTVGYTYIRSHALHDLRHFREIIVPLQQACKTRDDIELALSGLKQMHEVKTSFLDGMELFRQSRENHS